MKADQSSIKMCQIFGATAPWNMLCETIFLSAPASDTVREEQKNHMCEMAVNCVGAL